MEPRTTKKSKKLRALRELVRRLDEKEAAAKAKAEADAKAQTEADAKTRSEAVAEDPETTLNPTTEADHDQHDQQQSQEQQHQSDDIVRHEPHHTTTKEASELWWETLTKGQKRHRGHFRRPTR